VMHSPSCQRSWVPQLRRVLQRRRGPGALAELEARDILSRRCTVCRHPESFAINEALVLEKVSNRAITRQFGLHHDAVRRHRKHIPELLVKASQAMEVAQADDLLEEVRSLQRRAYAILNTAEQTGELRTALAAIREVRGNLELLAKLLGELDERPVINLTTSPEWIELRAVIVTALEPHQDAQESVLKAIRSVNGG
jgi:hypothetical protein